jgi:uncharacterized protein (DUF4415 family)
LKEKVPASSQPALYDEEESSAADHPPSTELATMIAIQRWKSPPKKLITLRIDSDVLAWFRQTGDGYQSRINETLRRYKDAAVKEAS